MSQANQETKPLPWVGVAALLGVVVWAVALCYVSGLRGFFALDQSIVFDGAWRVMQGQAPYRDFLLPYGPVSLWLQAAAFSCFGLSYKVYVLTAAALNGIGAAMAYGLFRRLVPERRWLAVVVGLLTGIWLYAPMGTTYPEQTGFVTVLAALSAVVAGLDSQRPLGRWLWMAVTGAALGVAALCKTNAGLFALPAFLVIATGMKQRPARTVAGDLLAIGLGFGCICAAFAVWLWTCSSPDLFRYSVLQVAGAQGRERLLGRGFRLLLAGLLTGKGNDGVRIMILGAATVLGLGLLAVLSGRLTKGVRAERIRMLAIMALALIGYQHAFSWSSSNNGVNEVPFIGLILGCAAEVLLTMAGNRQAQLEDRWTGLGKSWAPVVLGTAIGLTVLLWPRNLNLVAGSALGVLVVWGARWWQPSDANHEHGQTLARSWIRTALCLWSACSFGLGIWTAYNRNVQDIFDHRTRYATVTETGPLQGLHWAQGARPGAVHADWNDFEALWRELRDDKGRFFILGDYTILYGLTAHPSVGPLLFYHRGLTYSEQYDPRLDRRLAEAVDQPDVSRIVMEEKRFMGQATLRDFPMLRAAIEARYHSAERHGFFQVYRRNSPDAK